VAPTVGPLKLSAGTAVQTELLAASEVVMGEKLFRYEKVSEFVLVLPPLHHCSPV
jgi:acetoin utilization deacetylase AcuC-like enzyme